MHDFRSPSVVNDLASTLGVFDVMSTEESLGAVEKVLETREVKGVRVATVLPHKKKSEFMESRSGTWEHLFFQISWLCHVVRDVKLTGPSNCIFHLCSAKQSHCGVSFQAIRTSGLGRRMAKKAARGAQGWDRTGMCAEGSRFVEGGG